MKKVKFLGIIVLAFFIINNLTAQQYKVGSVVSDFSLKNVDGEKISLSDYKDQNGVILVFTCNTCPVAQKYEDRIVALHNKYEKQGYPVLAINPNDTGQKPGDSMEEMKKRAEKKGYDFAYVRDDNQMITKKFGAERTPEVFILEKNKKHDFVIRYTGSIDNNPDNPASADKQYVNEAINHLMSGKDLAVTETNAVGCTIKWKK
jgi:peroxiredoxin